MNKFNKLLLMSMMFAACEQSSDEHQSPKSEVLTDSKVCENVDAVTSTLRSGKEFEYYYRYIDALKKTERNITVIALPGGPGSGNISRSADLSRLFNKFNVIAIDPRGIHCNRGLQYDVNDLTSSEIAKDVTNVIKKELSSGRITEYVLFGQSYGTVIATHVAAAINTIQKPNFVVLEGTIGRAFKEKERYETYIQSWEKHLSEFPSLLQTMQEQSKRYAHRSFSAWVQYYFSLLRSAPLEDLQQILNGMVNEGTHPHIENYFSQFHLVSNDSESMSVMERFHQIISCRELHGYKDTLSLSLDWSIEIDSLDQSQTCEKTGNLDLAFDASQFQIDVPILYIHGKLDPATPFFQYEYHLSQQPAHDVTSVILTDRSHAPTGVVIDMACFRGLFDSMVEKRAVSFSGNTIEFCNQL